MLPYQGSIQAQHPDSIVLQAAWLQVNGPVVSVQCDGLARLPGAAWDMCPAEILRGESRVLLKAASATKQGLGMLVACLYVGLASSLPVCL